MTYGGGFDLFADSEYLTFLRAELHLPAFLPDSKSVNVVFQTHCICLVVNGEVCYGVVCKDAHGGVKVLGEVVDVNDKQTWSKHRALRDSWCDRHGPAPLPINDHHQGTVGQKALDPIQGASPDPVTGNLPQQAHMTNFIKCITEVHYQYTSLVASMAVAHQVLQKFCKLHFAWEDTSELVLKWVQ